MQTQRSQRIRNAVQTAIGGATAQVKGKIARSNESGALARIREAATEFIPSRQKSPFVGQRLYRQMQTIPQLAAQLAEGAQDIKPVSVKLPGATKPWHKFGIFFEAEAKMKFNVPDAQVESAAETLRQALRAAPEKGMAALLPPEQAKKFAGWTVVVDKPENAGVTPFSDIYIDDAKLTLNQLNGGIRVRRIGGDTDGKFEVKLPGDWIQGSEVLGRLEVVKHLMGSTWEQVVADWKKDPTDIQHPLTILKLLVPQMDIDSLEAKTDQIAQREQYVIKSPDGQDAFLITLDRPEATRVATGKTGAFYEVEIERMDGSIKQENLQELIDLTTQVARQFNLCRSGGTKYNEGMRVTE